jgi:hypothetical protein
VRQAAQQYDDPDTDKPEPKNSRDSGIEEFDISETDQFSAGSLSGRVMSFLQRIDIDDQSPVYYLSKYDHYGNGEQKAFVGKFEDCEPPDEAMIGARYGAGRYILTCQVPATNNRKAVCRVYRFRVSPSFDKSNSTSTLTPNHPIMQPPVVVNQQASMSEALAMVEKIMMMLVPLVNRPRDENVLGILQQNYSSVNDLMKKQMQDNLKMITDYQRTIASISEETEMATTTTDEPEDKPTIMEQFAPLIQQWMPILLGGGPRAAAAGALVQTVPQVQEILKDKLQLRKIISYLDNEHGVNKTDQILGALKIQRSGKPKTTDSRVVPINPVSQNANMQNRNDFIAGRKKRMPKEH